MEQIILKSLETIGLPLLFLIGGWLIGKYVTPWVHAKPSRLETAKEIAIVADRITDELLVMFPSASWDDILDKAVDKIIQSLDINTNIARREAISQLKSKMDK